MTPAQRLHTFARRVCMKRHSLWCKEYEPLVLSGKDRDGYYYTDEACEIFPRYNVAQSALVDIEKLNFDNLPNLEELRQLLGNVWCLQKTDFERLTQTQIAARAEADELEKLRHSILEFARAPEKDVQPLFYRRVLSENEAEDYWSELKKALGCRRRLLVPTSREISSKTCLQIAREFGQ
ncbi:MAG: hypothetical protein AAGK23_02840 [Pseudomonadota bacterium]